MIARIAWHLNGVNFTQIQGLPLNRITHTVAAHLGNKIGKFISADIEEGRCESTLRIRVAIGVNKPLKRVLQDRHEILKCEEEAISLRSPKGGSWPRQTGGLALLWKKDIRVDIQTYSRNHIDAIIFKDSESQPWRLTGCYGEPIPTRRHHTWSLLHWLSTKSTIPWLCVGDFNEVLHESEKQGGDTIPNWRLRNFRQAILKAGLVDLGFSGHPFTWTNRRENPNTIWARLDRALACNKWTQQFPKARVFHCLTRASDHAPLLVKTEHSDRIDPKLHKKFRFEALWVKHEECEKIIRDKWIHSSGGEIRNSIHNTLNLCKTSLIQWNRACVGNITEKIKKMRDKLHAIRLHPRDDNSKLEETRLRTELEDLLDKEELLWRQRGKAQWIHEGDKNTAFFHARATSRKRNNQIVRLKNDHGNWFETPEEIENIALQYFTTLFRSCCPTEESLEAVLNAIAGRASYGCFYLFRGEPGGVHSLKVKDLMVPYSNQWNVDLIRRTFDAEDANLILGIPLPRCDREDQLIWHFTRNGKYSVKTGYHLAKRYYYLKTEELRGGGSSGLNDKLSWLFIWSSNIPEKIKITVWRLATNSLPLRQNLARKKIITDTTCPLCDGDEETAIHRVIDCDFARQCWALSNLPHSAWKHRDRDVEMWLRNLHQNLDYNQWRFAQVILWYMWQQRNLKNVGDRFSNPLDVIRLSNMYLQTIDSQCLNNMGQSQQPSDHNWQPPGFHSIKINFDASVSTSKSCGGLGIIARDHTGSCLGWKRIRIHGNLHPTTAEAMAAREAVYFAKEKGWRNIVVEGDCLAVITGIPDAEDKYSVESPIYQDIRDRLEEFESFELKYVRRHVNSLAHKIATFCDMDCSGISLPL
ncbi:hypothetical protein DH2020_000179 [Rehmannia glutinosa]|uniref:RNase H type-1 domain-containing protein n=1 Tax=Rehmannia glutinosa TaxID=99300 RepID=A0ABR0XVS5_REHGL